MFEKQNFGETPTFGKIGLGFDPARTPRFTGRFSRDLITTPYESTTVMTEEPEYGPGEIVYREETDLSLIDIERRLDKAFASFDPKEKVAILIDGANLQKTTKAMNFGIDYLKLRDVFNKYLNVHSLYFFTAVDKNKRKCHTREMVNWMQKAGGFRVQQKPAKMVPREISPNDTRTEKSIRGNMDVELTVVALSNCRTADHLIIATGDGDFCYLVDQLQRDEKKVTILSTRTTDPCMVSNELLKQADNFLDIADLMPAIRRDTPGFVPHTHQ